MALKMKNVIQAKAKEKQAEFYGNQYKSGLSQKSDEVQMRTDEELSKLAGFNLGGLVYWCPESDSAHLLFAAKGVTFRYPPAGGVSLTYVIGAFLFSI